jgi:hypothetical protein
MPDPLKKSFEKTKIRACVIEATSVQGVQAMTPTEITQMIDTYSFTARKIAVGTYSVREDSMPAGQTLGKVVLCDVYDTSLWVFVPVREDMSRQIGSSEDLDEVLAGIRALYVDLRRQEEKVEGEDTY